MSEDLITKTIMKMAGSPDGFEWNPYSHRKVQRKAGRLKKAGDLVVVQRLKADRIILKVKGEI